MSKPGAENFEDSTSASAGSAAEVDPGVWRRPQQTGRGSLHKRHALADRLLRTVGHLLLFLIASGSILAVLLIILFIIRYAFPFFFEGQKSFPWINFGHLWSRVSEFFGSTIWRPTEEPGSFGALAIFVGSLMVTAGAVIVAVPLGVLAAVCLSDVLPFRLRQYVKPIIEILAAIPSVAYGFFALVIFAPLLQRQGGGLLALAMWIVGVPLSLMAATVLSDLLADRFLEEGNSGQTRGGRVWHRGRIVRLTSAALMLAAFGWLLWQGHLWLSGISIDSGANALNVSLILGIMALPTIVSVSEDALYAVGRDLREGSYALGATRAETVLKVVLPAARSGILAAVVLGVMRALGETMVVWMASGNAVQIPDGLNFLKPIRTVTATVAAEMGEADHTAGADHYSSLFALALVLLVVSLLSSMISEYLVRRGRRLGR